MTCNVTTVWGEGDVLCSLFGNGACVNGSCHCINGYRNDLTFLRQRDCHLPPYLMAILHGYMILSCTLGLGFIARKYPDSVGVARRILQCNACWAILLSLYAIVMFAYDHHMSGIGLILYVLHVRTGFLSVYLILYSLASPLYKMAELSEDRMVRMTKIIWTSFAILTLAVALPAAVLYGDFNDPSNDEMWNIFASATLIVIVIDTMFIMIAVPFAGVRMVGIVKSIIEKAPENQVQDAARIFVKIRKILLIFYTAGPVIGISSAIIPALYLLGGFRMPLSFAALSMILVSDTFTMIGFTYYFSTRVNMRERKEAKKAAETVMSMQAPEIKPELFSRDIGVSLDGDGSSVHPHPSTRVRNYLESRVAGLPSAAGQQYTELTSVQSYTEIGTVSDPALLANNSQWHQRVEWEEMKDKQGVVFYFNSNTKEVSFDPPSQLSPS